MPSRPSDAGEVWQWHPVTRTFEQFVAYLDRTGVQRGIINSVRSQMAKDVSAFLVWTAEPNLGARRATGLAVTIFLLFATILGYFAYRQLWHDAKREVRPTGPLDPENQAKSRSAKAKQGVTG